MQRGGLCPKSRDLKLSIEFERDGRLSFAREKLQLGMVGCLGSVTLD
jgi:hypothetical protein